MCFITWSSNFSLIRMHLDLNNERLHKFNFGIDGFQEIFWIKTRDKMIAAIIRFTKNIWYFAFRYQLKYATKGFTNNIWSFRALNPF